MSMQEIYESIKMEYLKSDAINHARDRGTVITDKEALELAKEFDSSHDCNIADNDAWDCIIKNFEKRKGES